jgi:iron-sulfur cluster assembly accessory protein
MHASSAFPQRASRRTLATTSDLSSAKPAHPILNPRNDDSGNLMTISISPRASNRLHAISTSDKNPNLALRVSVESGGCHGFQYLMDLTDLGKAPATEEDTVFEGEKGEKVVIDEPSLELLKGSTVDYTMELIGSQFKVTGIPGATSSCGCGTSFDIQL